jgi:glycosyltransferase involved in cell wall biosynthesis
MSSSSVLGDVAADEAGNRAPRIALLLGGFDPPERSADVAAGRRPSNDVGVLVDSLGATVFDFGWLAAEGGSGPWHRRLLHRHALRSGKWSAALALATMGAVRRFDLVYVSGEDIGLVTCSVSRLLPGRSPEFIVRIESGVYGRTRFRRSVHRRAMRFALSGVGALLCRTAALAEYVRDGLEVPATQVVALGQEIDTAYFSPDNPPGRLPPVDQPYVLSAGLELRDYRTLLEAVDGLPVTLVVAAGSPWSKDQFPPGVDLPPNVVVGRYEADEMRELYRHASLVAVSVLPTRRACGMNVVGEAWAMGKPVVATATAGLGEYITDGVNGLLVPAGDAAALRSAMSAIMASDDLAHRLGTQGRAYVRSNLSLANFEAVVTTSIESGLTARTR